MILKKELENYWEGSKREFLLTNGNGSFCNHSINGNYARSYHGLFVKSFKAPLERWMTFHKVEETINNLPLYTKNSKINNNDSIIEGYKFIESFEINPFPKWIFNIEGNIVEKEIFMPFERDLIVIKYKVIKKISSKLNFNSNLFINYRRPGETREHQIDSYNISLSENILKVDFPNLSKMKLISSHHIEEKREVKERNIAYDFDMKEIAREDLDSSYKIGKISTNLLEGDELWILASFEDEDSYDYLKLYSGEANRIKKIRHSTSATNKLLQDLGQSSDNFIVNRETPFGLKKTILAGYPWFGDWGRDTMIAFTGLTLCTNRFDDAKSILKTFAKYSSEGMIPNLFPSYQGEGLSYNTIDAPMWYLYAVEKFLEYTKDYNFIEKEIFPTLESIINYYINGTRFNIKSDIDGLISGGDKYNNLTWMDVKINGEAVTPRFGKAVEISALFYNGLKLMEELAKKYNKDDKIYKKHSSLIKENFEKVFWNEEKNCLYDYISEDEKNYETRPNQIFVVSLKNSLLSKEKEKLVVDKVFKELYTNCGIKSLAKNEKNYRGIYRGDIVSRDLAYHQGTTWGWLIGHFIGAYDKVYNNKKSNLNLMEGLIEHFYKDAGIFSVSEIFNGDSPHTPKGCYAQAWSVAELLRALKEYTDIEK